MFPHLASQIALWFLLICPLFSLTEFGVTYEFSGGRFGDSLLSYLHAKWIAYEKNITLFYKPFVYSSKLLLDDLERPVSSLRSEPRIRVIYGNGPVNPNISLPVLYICPYFPEDTWELSHTSGLFGIPWTHFDVNWKDPKFRELIWNLIQPKKSLNKTYPPKGQISIAIHFREGGGFDDILAHQGWPLKFPPLHFYVDSLLQAIDLCQNKPIYCYVFTDALEPECVVQALQKAIPREVPIFFDYRKKDNSPNSNVLEDFFSFTNFDILIRPQSNYSIIPSLIHDFAAVYSPKNFVKNENKQVLITEINIEIHEETLSQALR